MAILLHRTPDITLATLEDIDIPEAQRVFDDAPTYHRHVLGKTADPQMAHRCFHKKPPAPRHGLRVWKYMMGVFTPDASAQMVGVIDLFVGFPRYDVATLATFILRENQQRRGWGGKATDALALWIRTAHPATQWFDITITDDNLPATRFLLGHGFQRTDTWDKIEIDGKQRRVIRLERPLRAPNSSSGT